MDLRILYIPCKDEVEAKKIAHHLLEQKGIACANIFPITSVYGWKGKVVDDSEVVLLLKTSQDHVEKVKQEVKKIHSYEVPCILTLQADVNKEYEDWVSSQLKS